MEMAVKVSFLIPSSFKRTSLDETLLTMNSNLATEHLKDADYKSQNPEVDFKSSLEIN